MYIHTHACTLSYRCIPILIHIDILYIYTYTCISEFNKHKHKCVYVHIFMYTIIHVPYTGDICYGTPCKVPYVKIGLCKHAMLGVVDFAEYLANSEEYAYKLLAGYATTESCKWKAEFASFWQKFATVEPHHDVFRRYNHCLGNCCPIFLHGDEGTSYGKKGLFQFSWSPVLSAGASGLHRYFMISQLSYKFYAKLAKGNAKGNPALDAIMAAGCQSCWTAYEVGVKCGQERIYLVTIGLTGDHVFHASLGRICNTTYIYICMYVCTYTYTYMGKCISIYIYTYKYMCTYIYIYMHVYIYIYTRGYRRNADIDAYVYIYMCIYIYAYEYIYIYIHMHMYI